MRMIEIKEIRDIAWQGKTEPVFCVGVDDNEYVVKGTHAGRKALISEWVAGRLGRLLNLPIPEFNTMRVPSALFEFGANQETLSRLGRGVLFGSRVVPNTVEIRQADVELIDPMLRARVLAFDYWIANSDRVFIEGYGNPNLLWSDAGRSLTVIDHNLAFEPSLMSDFWREHIFRDSRSLWSERFVEQMSADFTQALARLPTIWSELPAEWTEDDLGISRQAVEAILWQFSHLTDTFWRTE
jgi:hypothetical protein